MAFRRQLGLPDRGNPLFEGSHSPRLVLALFSPCLAQPQPDWPPQTVVTGFPFFDRHHQQAQIEPALLRFLSDGPPPVVFTLGSSAVGAAGDFYRDSLTAIEKMDMRALFLTGPYPQGLPETLPSGVLAVPTRRTRRSSRVPPPSCTREASVPPRKPCAPAVPS